MSDTVLWYATRGAGAVTLVLLSMVVMLGVLSVRRFELAGWPRFLTTGLHRNLSLLAVAFLAFHIVTAVVDPFTHLGWATAVLPFASYYRTFWLGLGTVAAELFAAVLVTSGLRRRIGHGAWRMVHRLAYASWPIAVAHGLGTGTDSHSGWMLGVVGLSLLGVVAAVLLRLLGSPVDRLAPDRARFRTRVTRDRAG